MTDVTPQQLQQFGDRIRINQKIQSNRKPRKQPAFRNWKTIGTRVITFLFQTVKSNMVLLKKHMNLFLLKMNYFITWNIHIKKQNHHHIQIQTPVQQYRLVEKRKQRGRTTIITRKRIPVKTSNPFPFQSLSSQPSQQCFSGCLYYFHDISKEQPDTVYHLKPSLWDVPSPLPDEEKKWRRKLIAFFQQKNKRC